MSSISINMKVSKEKKEGKIALISDEKKEKSKTQREKGKFMPSWRFSQWVDDWGEWICF